MQKLYTLHSLRKRILALIVLVSLLFCALSVRLFVIQIINGKSLQSKATSQWTRDLAIIAPRGTIYDRTGSTLAVSYTTYNVYARAREITQKDEVASFLSSKLDINFSTVYDKISQKNISEVLIKMQVDSSKAEEIYNQKFSGIYLAENVARYYPYGDFLTQILGFTSSDNIGQTGAEAYFNSSLQGKDGYSFTQSDLQGKEICGKLRYYVAGTKGEDLQLSIDSKIELIVEQTLEQIMQEQKAKSVTGIVMNAKTGEILALSTKPSFNLNEVPRDNLTELFDYSKIKGITDLYEPGSTFKILTLAAALEEGLTNFNERFYCPGYNIVDGVRIKCWRSIGHGSQTLVEGFANSCNCVFMNLALRLGKERFYKYAKLFGIGEKTGVNLSGEAKGILMPQKYVKNVDLARMGFGHAITVSPIQLLTSVSGIVNGGNLPEPTIKKVESPNVRRNILSSETSKKMNYLLEKATNKHGDYSFVEGYNVGGKTGTAQKYDESGKIAQGKYISSFIGVYPASDPDYAILVFVDEPGAGAYYGSIVALPYGKIIFNKMFEYLNIPKENEDVKTEYVKMPNVEGMTISEASDILIKLGIDFELYGESGRVSKQLPPEGEDIAVGDTIVLIT